MTVSGQREAGFETTTLEAEFVPALKHARAICHIMILEVVEADFESTFVCCHSIGIIPL
jgi:hypothetical protein